MTVQFHEAVQQSNLPLVVQFMLQNVNLLWLQEVGIIFLKSLAQRDQEYQHRITAVGGVEAILAAMRQHPLVPGLQEDGIESILSLICTLETASWIKLAAESSAEHRRALSTYAKVVDLGCVDTILQSIKKFLISPSICLRGIRLLRLLARAENNETRIARLGGLDVIFDVMRTHPLEADLHEQSCRALSNLAMNDCNKLRISELGGIEAILDSMKLHVAAPSVQQWACGALANLAFNDQIEIKISSLGGMEAILDAMAHNEDHAGVQGEAIAALWNLSSASRHRTKLVALDGVKAIVRAMRRHCGEEEVQEFSFGVLRNLAREEGARIVAAGGAEAALDAMERLADSAVVQEGGCALIRRLADESPRHQPLACACRAVAAALAAVRRHPTAERVMQEACRALRQLFQHGEAWAVEAVALGGAETLLSAMLVNAGRRVPTAAAASRDAVQREAYTALVALGPAGLERVGGGSIWRWLRRRECGLDRTPAPRRGGPAPRWGGAAPPSGAALSALVAAADPRSKAGLCADLLDRVSAPRVLMT